ncbi:MAG: hypothetical protein J6S23_03970 [Clostridia bacterium]|nr:hypothetical protein [Clostridia bacterium]
MAKLFRIIAVIIMAISAFIGVLSITTLGEEGAFLILIGSLMGVVLGLALYTVGDLLDRVNYLEDQLNMHFIEKSEDELPLVKCKKCGTEYEMDYPKCPNCKTKTTYNN